MFQEFTLSEALEAIKDKKEFKVNTRSDYTVIDYNITTDSTFVGRTERESMILRNLRGTAFCNKRGWILSLPFHKFHNLNECQGYMESDIDFNQSHVIEEKLDGSMIRVIPTSEHPRGWVFATRAGETDVSKLVEEYFNNLTLKLKQKYTNLITYELLVLNRTPIFEFTSRKNKVVIDYPEDNLVYLCTRCNDTGMYFKHDFLQIPCVKEVKLNNLKDVYSWLDREGVVVTFNSGFKVKVKAEDYVRKHRVKDLVRFEKDVVKLILEDNLDDLLPFIEDDIRLYVLDYKEKLLNSIKHFKYSIGNTTEIYKATVKTKKDFAFSLKKCFPLELHQFMYQAWDNKEIQVEEYLTRNCSSSTKIHKVLLDLSLPSWYDYYTEYLKR